MRTPFFTVGLGAISLWVITAWAAFAHALPGSILRFEPTDTQVNLTISLPVEDLVIADPDLQPLTDVDQGDMVPDTVLSDLSDYMAQHLQVSVSDKALLMSLTQAVMDMGENDHVGQYDLLVMSMTAHWADPLVDVALTYDGAMHEVRNHRALVYWTGDDGQSVPVAEFGYKPTDGAQRPVLLDLPDPR